MLDSNNNNNVNSVDSKGLSYNKELLNIRLILRALHLASLYRVSALKILLLYSTSSIA